MGMYDTIKNELFCPFCGTKQKGNSFQTKNFNRCLNSLDIFKIKGIDYTIITTCSNCNNWIELNIETFGVHELKEGKKQIIKMKKDISKLFKK